MNIPTKVVQGKLWSSAPGQWAKYQEPSFIPMYEYVLDHVVSTEETMLLDAGCGAGLFLSLALATGAEVHGIDAAPGMLAIAKARATGAAILLEDLEALPFIDGTFDIVTGFDVFQYAGNLDNAVAEARRVVKRHGIVAIGLRDRNRNPSAAILKAVADLQHPQLNLLTEDNAHSNERRFYSFLNTAGLRLRSKEAVYCPVSFQSEAELLEGFRCMGPCAAAIATVGEEAVNNCIIQQAQPYNLADDVYYLKNYFNVYMTEKI